MIYLTNNFTFTLQVIELNKSEHKKINLDLSFYFIFFICLFVCLVALIHSNSSLFQSFLTILSSPTLSLYLCFSLSFIFS